VTVDLDELERLAKAASEDIDPDNVFASPWWTADYLADHERHMSITDAAFIEKASPAAVLELVTNLRRARNDVAVYREDLAALESKLGAMSANRPNASVLAIAIRELKERRNNYAAQRAHLDTRVAVPEVLASYDATLAEIDGAIAVLERLRGET
jgi:hypothetical protein